MKLFCYGTLLDPQIQHSLWGHCKSGPVGCVADAYMLYGDEPRLQRCAHPGNPGLLGRTLTLTQQELEAAIAYEGPSYSLAEVELDDGTLVVTFL